MLFKLTPPINPLLLSLNKSIKVGLLAQPFQQVSVEPLRNRRPKLSISNDNHK
jgi:hypothetical protein